MKAKLAKLLDKAKAFIERVKSRKLLTGASGIMLGESIIHSVVIAAAAIALISINPWLAIAMVLLAVIELAAPVYVAYHAFRSI